jgi:hypothetical protein
MTNRQATLSSARVVVVWGIDCLVSNPFVIVAFDSFPQRSVVVLS